MVSYIYTFLFGTMANIESLNIPEQKDVSTRLNEIYERCDQNILQLCKKFKAIQDGDFDPLKMDIKDIAEIQRIFPEWEILSSTSLHKSNTPIISIPEYTKESLNNPLQVWNKENYVRFAGNKIKIKTEF